MRKILLAVSAAAILAPTPVLADPPPWAPAHGRRAHERQERERHVTRVYYADGRYVRPHVLTERDRIWRGDDGRYHCRRDNGTTGLVIGAAVGALAGHEIAGRQDKTLGTILGAIGGGLLGQAIDRGDLKCE
jgi:uncharacterized protein YcfJ